MNKRSIIISKAGYVGILVFALILIGGLLWSDSHTFKLSHKSGFYDESFELRIGIPNGTRVFYTLDGSEPSVDSMEYIGPILIEDATSNPNVYANITDVVPEYDENSDQLLHYVVPKEKIDKCTVVRAICVDKNGITVDQMQASYFVGFDKKSGYDNMWICSLITDPDNLFDAKTGIMVCGESMEKTEDDRYINTNFSQSGPEWEREAFIQFFDAEQKNVLSQMCGIRIHGNVSRNMVSKSFSLYSREEYDGHDKFLYNFWGDGYYPDKLMLMSGGQDGITLVRDKLVSDLTKDLAYSSYHYVPCVMFIDGEYWGIHYITEKFNPAYFNHYFGTEKEDLFVLKDFMSNPEWALTEGAFDMEVDQRKWNDFAICISGREEMGLTQEIFEKTFDYDSFLDYFATEIYIARNGDWPPLNMSYWSSKAYGSTPNDGKWRFLLYDVYYDSMSQPEHDTVTYARELLDMFNYELNNEKFSSDFNEKLQYLGDAVFSEERIENYLNEYYEMMKEPIAKHYKRFYGETCDESDFASQLEGIKQFFIRRKEFFRNEE